nr:hypothetical protein [Tanacetum cinerariifolium]
MRKVEIIFKRDLFDESENHEKQKTEVEISKEDLYNESGYPRGSRILYVGLKDLESVPWSWFTVHPVCQHAPWAIGWEAIGKVLIDLDHPVVPVISNFAITAFNKLCSLSDFLKESKEKISMWKNSDVDPLGVRGIVKLGVGSKYKGIDDLTSVKLISDDVKAEWLVPNEKTGLQRKSNEHTCGGYDYVNPLKVFSCYK